MGDTIVFLMILFICASIFISIGIFALNKKTPINFWSGTTVSPEEIRDIKAYNRANGLMWIIYGASYILYGVLGFFVSGDIITLIMIVGTLGGLILMVMVYRRIYGKYKV